MARKVKGEPSSRPVREDADTTDSGRSEVLERRVLRSRYLAVKNLISDERDCLSKNDSEKFQTIIDEVETLHQLVQKPREQVADAEALLDITNTLVTSVKAQSNEGVTPSEFISFLLRDFGQQGAAASSSTGDGVISVKWKEIGLAVSHIFRNGSGCCTMLGPMDTELKQRKAHVQRKRTRLTERTKPEELDGPKEEKTDTDQNMATMFNILRKYRKVKLEVLILNKNSFAQTVENLFALSFLVKDGRAEIKVDEKGCHLVSPRNAPAANAIASGVVCYNHFVFRFDYNDWKLMIDSVGDGEGLMPHRNNGNIGSSGNSETRSPEETGPTTPIRKLSRNRGLVLQEQTVVEDTPDRSDSSGAAAIRKGKRKVI